MASYRCPRASRRGRGQLPPALDAAADTRRQRRRMVVGWPPPWCRSRCRLLVLTRSDPDVVVGEIAVGVVVRATTGGSARLSRSGSGQPAWPPVRQRVGDQLHRRLGVPHRPRQRRFNPGQSRGSSPSGVAVGAGAVWVANSGNATVSGSTREHRGCTHRRPARARPASWWRSGRCGSPTPWTHP